MNGVQSEETTQTVGNIRFVVVSQFQEKGLSVQDKIKHLLEREIHEKNVNCTFDEAGHADYNK